VDIIISIFHANTPPRVRQQSSDVPSARTHISVGERVVSLVLCTSSTNTWTRSSFQSVLRKPQRMTKYDRPWRHHHHPAIHHAASSSRCILIERLRHRAALSIARHSHRAASSSHGTLYRAASSSRGILYCAASSSRGIVIVRHYPSHGIIHRTASSSYGIIINKQQASFYRNHSPTSDASPMSVGGPRGSARALIASAETAAPTTR
jgi:hypothetical protein